MSHRVQKDDRLPGLKWFTCVGIFMAVLWGIYLVVLDAVT